MDAALQAVLADIYQEGQLNDEREHKYSQRMMNLEPDTAHLLSVLVGSSHRRNVLEIGTSSGYSTLWLAWSVSAVGGRVTSIDREAYKHEMADKNLRRAGLRANVELVQGDATAIISALAGPFDCVFFDADRYSAPAQLELLLPKLTADALLLADNVLSHPAEIAGYLAAVEALPDFEHAVIPVGKGLSVAYRREEK